MIVRLFIYCLLIILLPVSLAGARSHRIPHTWKHCHLTVVIPAHVKISFTSAGFTIRSKQDMLTADVCGTGSAKEAAKEWNRAGCHGKAWYHRSWIVHGGKSFCPAYKVLFNITSEQVVSLDFKSKVLLPLAHHIALYSKR